MAEKAKHTEIKGFVKGTLHCNCPDEVFADIDLRKNPYVSSYLPYSTRLLVGQRLLIYIVNLPDVASLPSLLPSMIGAGKRERDEKGLNRFRAVIVTPTKEDLEPIATELFDAISGRDDRMHLHVIDKKLVPDL